MLVELVRIIEEKHVIDVKCVISSTIAANCGNVRFRLSLEIENRHHALRSDSHSRSNLLSLSVWSRALDNVSDLKLLQWRKQSSRMLEIDLSTSIRKVINLISCLHPNRLACEIFLC